MSEQNDRDLIEQRRLQDMRVFLTNALNPENAPRLAPALGALRGLLVDGQWHTWTAAVAAMLRASDLAVKTTDIQLRAAIKCGAIERRGEYVRGAGRQPATDTREVRLGNWPDR